MIKYCHKWIKNSHWAKAFLVLFITCLITIGMSWVIYGRYFIPPNNVKLTSSVPLGFFGGWSYVEKIEVEPPATSPVVVERVIKAAAIGEMRTVNDGASISMSTGAATPKVTHNITELDGADWLSKIGTYLQGSLGVVATLTSSLATIFLGAVAISIASQSQYIAIQSQKLAEAEKRREDERYASEIKEVLISYREKVTDFVKISFSDNFLDFQSQTKLDRSNNKIVFRIPENGIIYFVAEMAQELFRKKAKKELSNDCFEMYIQSKLDERKWAMQKIQNKPNIDFGVEQLIIYLEANFLKYKSTKPIIFKQTDGFKHLAKQLDDLADKWLALMKGSHTVDALIDNKDEYRSDYTWADYADDVVTKIRACATFVKDESNLTESLYLIGQSIAVQNMLTTEGENEGFVNNASKSSYWLIFVGLTPNSEGNIDLSNFLTAVYKTLCPCGLDGREICTQLGLSIKEREATGDLILPFRKFKAPKKLKQLIYGLKVDIEILKKIPDKFSLYDKLLENGGGEILLNKIVGDQEIKIPSLSDLMIGLLKNANIDLYNNKPYLDDILRELILSEKIHDKIDSCLNVAEKDELNKQLEAYSSIYDRAETAGIDLTSFLNKDRKNWNV